MTEPAGDTDAQTIDALLAHDDPSMPALDGEVPVGVVTKLNGAGQRIHRAMRRGEKGVLLVEYEVDEIGHKTTNDGPKRKHTLKVLDLYELAPRPGARLLNHAKEEWRLSHPEAAPLPLEQAGDEAIVDAATRGRTDGSGVVLTDAERAELGLDDPTRDPCVVVFEGGARHLWPDDFGREPGARPVAGDRRVVPGAKGKKKLEEVLVRQLLDAQTGDQLAEWTDEQEFDRLQELEEELGREEARLDREAAEELEAARGR